MSEEKKEQIITEEEMKKHYYWYVFYYNPEDSRVIVPKRCKWLGWTVNLGNKTGQFVFSALMAAVVSSLIYCQKNDVKCNFTFSDLYEIVKSKFNV